jgi:hypothetical protein
VPRRAELRARWQRGEALRRGRDLAGCRTGATWRPRPTRSPAAGRAAGLIRDRRQRKRAARPCAPSRYRPQRRRPHADHERREPRPALVIGRSANVFRCNVRPGRAGANWRNSSRMTAKLASVRSVRGHAVIGLCGRHRKDTRGPVRCSDL